jgi:hypothetical protein
MVTMDFSRRLDLYENIDFDGHPDEELPDYEPESSPAPDYFTSHYETPLVTYHLRQFDRKSQVFVPYGPSASSYKINTHTFRMFSKKPEMEIIHVPPVDGVEQSVAKIWFDHDGPLPWRPRARVVHGRSTHALESRNFNDWTMSINDVLYTWTSESRPVSLVLQENGTDVVIARFTYSGRGVLAMKGAEVGELTIYRDGLTSDNEGVEKIIGGLMVSIVHYKSMGRYYKNDEPVRVDSMSGLRLPVHRLSVASGSSR